MIIVNNRELIADFSARHYVEKLYVFGSAASDQLKPDSDIDLLVTFKKDVPLLSFGDNFFDYQEALQTLLERNVDLVVDRSLTNPYLIKSIENSKQLIYG